MKATITTEINLLEMAPRWQKSDWKTCDYQVRKIPHTLRRAIPEHCSRQAAVEIDGLKYCKQHAGEHLLNKAIKAGEDV